MLPAAEALELISQSCRGLDHAHRMGVVHRDVKPGNLLRSDEGVVKLADFGIAKAVSEESSITQIGSVLGHGRLSRAGAGDGEQAATPRSDIYSLGVVAYQLLAGRLPYEAQTLTELALKQQREAPPLLDAVNPDVTPSWPRPSTARWRSSRPTATRAPRTSAPRSRRRPRARASCARPARRGRRAARRR